MARKLVSVFNDEELVRAKEFYCQARIKRPQTREDLHNYVNVFLGLEVPDKKICAEHNSPMDYLWHSFGADFTSSTRANADAVVWANRGGGKTELAAVATLLDCVFKPKCQVRILAGSGEQAARMYNYLRAFLEGRFDEFLQGEIRKDRCRFTNGSGVEVLTQSSTSVRGQHVHKLRCDEVELFKEVIFSAAKFTTHSTDGLKGGMEMLSTMHRPYGLMQKIISSAGRTGTPVFKWCVWDVIEKCRDRVCSQCVLWGDCGGKAKQAAGYFKIDDCISAMRRSSRAEWESEMLCMKPNTENSVFNEFEPQVHVKAVDYDANLPLYRAIDFGFVNPFVCLWIQVDGDGVVRVFDEYVRSRATIDVHAVEVKQRTPGGEARVAATFCDPGGKGANDVTGTSAVRELRSMGITVRCRASGILEGIELIRRAIRSGDRQSRLAVSPRCPRLIEAMVNYHYPDAAGAELPAKDGVYDHPIDALRYFFVNYKESGKTISRRY